jgi:hypothetical protein
VAKNGLAGMLASIPQQKSPAHTWSCDKQHLRLP